jgi:hypothetical protein
VRDEIPWIWANARSCSFIHVSITHAHVVILLDACSEASHLTNKILLLMLSSFHVVIPGGKVETSMR